jgi:methionyl-tRNA synthetase
MKMCLFQKKLLKKEYIYKANYSGWYSVNDEAFVPEAHTREEVIDGEKVSIHCIHALSPKGQTHPRSFSEIYMILSACLKFFIGL